MDSKAQTKTPHKWRFFRSGGFDQVRLESAADLEHLAELDQKLWSVLGCPTSGLEFDSRTLALIDADGDGQIRTPEIVAAVNWTCMQLKDASLLFAEGDSVRIDQIDDSHPEGARLRAAAQGILKLLGKSDIEMISIGDLADPSQFFAAGHFNGDGIVPAALAEFPELARTIEAIIDACGSDLDRSGEPGIGLEQLERFFVDASALLAWRERALAQPDAILPLGEQTEAAAALFDSIRAKVEDYLIRCRLAAFDQVALEALSPGEATYLALARISINEHTPEVQALPLAQLSAQASIPLKGPFNPAWAEAMQRFRDQVVSPILGELDSLTVTQWQDLAAKFEQYRAWQADKPVSPVTALDIGLLQTAVSEGHEAQLRALIDQDRKSDTTAEAVDAVERLLRYRRDLVTLLNNYVSLADFYSRRKKAIFQAGTLYLDQRSCDLCMRVSNPDKHATLAPFSGAYLVYCNCVRKDEAPIQIVAALTGGDVDELIAPGRNGVFYDRAGSDWHATITKVVENPVSIRQAFWSPYKRIARMIGEQIQKFAASRDKAVEDKAAAGVAQSAAQVETPKAPAVPFDIAKFAGIFAAIGLALGALGTALAAVVSGLLSLPAWQMPLVLVGIMVLISGPSMGLAWLKLRQRNLGPLLDANGWAVNTRARINIPFGASLTGVAALPPGSARSLDDPYAEKRTPWKRYVVLLLLILLGWFAWQQGLLETVLGTLPAGVEGTPAEASAENGPAAAPETPSAAATAD